MKYLLYFILILGFYNEILYFPAILYYETKKNLQILFENETKRAILNRTKVKLSSAYKLLWLYPFHRKEIKREIFAIQSF